MFAGCLVAKTIKDGAARTIFCLVTFNLTFPPSWLSQPDGGVNNACLVCRLLEGFGRGQDGPLAEWPGGRNGGEGTARRGVKNAASSVLLGQSGGGSLGLSGGARFDACATRETPLLPPVARPPLPLLVVAQDLRLRHVSIFNAPKTCWCDLIWIIIIL